MWKFDQSTGALMDSAGTIVETGYSGKNPEGYNRPDMESVRNVGPIPRGWYSIGPPFTRGRMANCMRLTPYQNTETFGRDGFQIHGDNQSRTASTGCIVMSPATRELIADSGDAGLQVVRNSSFVTAAKLRRAPITAFQSYAPGPRERRGRP